MEIQKIRESWKPETVKVLVVGESPPANGTFFYCGDSNLYRYTKEAFEEAFGVEWRSTEEFLSFFRECGCYLVDLCDDPVNGLDDRLRQQKRTEGIQRLAREISQAGAAVQIVVMKDIVKYVQRARRRSGTRPKRNWELPFPVRSRRNQRRFVEGLTRALNELRHDGTLPN